MPTILFVCRANICHSPLAQGLFQKLKREGHFPGDWEARSAGTWAKEGAKAHPLVRALLAEEGVEMGEHRTQEINAGLMEEADLVLTMERGQMEALRAEYPEEADKVHMLSALKGKERDVVDPVRGTEADFRLIMNGIEGYLVGSGERMEELVERGRGAYGADGRRKYD